MTDSTCSDNQCTSAYWNSCTNNAALCCSGDAVPDQYYCEYYETWTDCTAESHTGGDRVDGSSYSDSDSDTLTVSLFPDGHSCSSDSQCQSNYCDNDGVGWSDDNHCFSVESTYYENQDHKCEESARAANSDWCDEKRNEDLNTCNKYGVSYKEDTCSDTCVISDKSIFECTDSGCSCSESLCDGQTTGSNIVTCSSGQTYFADKCTSTAGGEDRGDNICRSSSFAAGCTADSECNGVTAGTGDCSASCGYQGGLKSDGESCSSNGECQSNYCDNDGVGWSDDNHCFSVESTYYENQDHKCEESARSANDDWCDEKRNEDLNTCDKTGESYKEDTCSDTCVISDKNICRSSAFAAGCTADSECNGITAGTGDCDSSCFYIINKR